MTRSSCVSPLSFRFAASLFLVGGALLSNSFSATYDIRAVTNDNARAYTGKVKQGSFGAPTLNDKGSVAYPCILFGNKVNALTNSSIIYRPKGKKGAATAIQSGISIDNSFLPGYNQSNTYGVLGSATIYKIAKSICINNGNKIGFIAEVLNTVRTDNFQNGNYTSSTFRPDDRSDYGIVFPNSAVAGGFQNGCPSIYENYDPQILQRTVSINSAGSMAENASYNITGTRRVPGFDYCYLTVPLTGQAFDPAYPRNPDVNQPYDPNFPLNPYPYSYYGSGAVLVATTESNVIGLPYETVFSSFSDALIADQNRIFVVADISDTGSEFDGLWQGTNPNIQPIAVKQTKAPGGGVFSSFEANPGPNRKGTAVAFIANLTDGTSSIGVFRSNLSGKQIDLIAGGGQNAPGTTGVFSDFALSAVNDRGNVAFIGDVKTTSGAGLITTRTGVWVSDLLGKNLKLVIISGQTLTVGKKTKTVTRIAFNPVAALNKKGQVALTASFTDKTSAVIIATP